MALIMTPFVGLGPPIVSRWKRVKYLKGGKGVVPNRAWWGKGEIGQRKIKTGRRGETEPRSKGYPEGGVSRREIYIS